MLGVPSFWRDLNRDAVADSMLHEIIQAADVVSPWSVGRYRNPAEATRHAADVWKRDQDWCSAKDLEFLPVVFPGFSWSNLKNGKSDRIARLKGEFLWSQIIGAKRAGCNAIYIAMFDEVDEGTAIFKCSDNPPVGEGVHFVDNEGLPTDHYLKIAGAAGKLLRGEIAISEAVPDAKQVGRGK